MKSMMWKRSVALLVWSALAGLVLSGAAAAGLAAAVDRPIPVEPPTVGEQPSGAYARVPFGPGERVTFRARIGIMPVGSGSMEVVGMERVGGHLTYHARLQLAGGVPLARVDDKFDTWIDVDGIFSRRFKQDQKEARFRRYRTYDFFPDTRTYRRLDNDEVGSIPTDRPLDEIAFLYFARTLPLRVGDDYTIERYYKESGNPVRLTVLRRETITVPAGRFDTVVIRPVIRTTGLFGEGGEAEVYMTDDDRRIIVQIRSKVPVVGALTLQMVSYQPGSPLAPATSNP
jgi:hypothetical protein